MKRITLTLDEELLEEIEARYGEKSLLNFSAVVRRLLREAISNDS